MSTDLAQRLQAALGGAYAIERELGGGGMSRVFLAHEAALGRRVVVKVLAPELLAGLSVERFRREILLAAALQHPHIVGVIAAGEVDGIPYFTMPFVEGESLRQRLAAGPLPVREAVSVLRDVSRALAYAHGRGVVHRDIKPDNVLLSGGVAAVTDFGVAKAISSAKAAGPEAPGGTLTVVGTSLGTPAYMAPEQAAGDPDTDHRADIYALGVVAYELLAGKPPFHGRPPHQLVVAHISEPPPALAEHRPEVPPALAELVMRCLAKDPAVRPQSAADVIAALDDVLAGTSGAQRTPVAPVPSGAASRGVARRRGVLAAAGVAAAAALVALALLVGRERAGGAPPPNSLVVLPFANLGGNAADEYFSDGMTDELTSALSRVPGLRVASRTSAYAFKGAREDVREIARRLAVAAVLEGSVRRAGDRLRVNARLVGAAEGTTLWSETYEREARDVFAVQDAISRDIAGALQARLADAGTLPADARGAAAIRRGTESLEAYDLYLRGRFHFHRRGTAELRRAAAFFEQAIARDPRYANAHAGLADALGLLPIYGDTPADSVYPLARRAAERAVQLDDSLAEAHTTLGLIQKNAGEWAASERSFRRSIALDPQYATAHQWLGEVLIITGRSADAAAAMRRAAELDPASPVIAAELGYVLALGGGADEGIARGRRAVELSPGLWMPHGFLGCAYLFAARPREAVASLERATALDTTLMPFVGLLAYARAAAGDTARARAMVPGLEARAALPGGSAAGVAIAYAGVGDRERALLWLERAVAARDPFLYASSLNPVWFDVVRGDPRFAALAERMGLDPRVMTAPRATASRAAAGAGTRR